VKAAKRYTTELGMANLPSKMIHVIAKACPVTTPEGTPVVILSLNTNIDTKSVSLDVRMSADEARELSEQLLSATVLTLCPNHHDSLVWDSCSEGFAGCQIRAARARTRIG